MSKINRKSVLVSDGTGSINFLTAEGEVLASLPVPPGIHPSAPYLDLLPQGGSLEAAPGLGVVEPRSAVGVQKYGPGSHDSGANPDFQPTSVSRMELEMRQTLHRMQQATSRIEARERALQSIERIPRAPAQVVVDPDPLIEPGPVAAAVDG